jgi:hypothetical protein
VTTAQAPTAAHTATAAGSVTYPDVALDATAKAAPDLERLTRRTAGLRDEVSLVAQDTEALHLEVVSMSLGDRAARTNQGRTLVSMLEELADAGMSWAEIAVVAEVTPAAVRKWRRGGDAAGGKRMAVAQLMSLLEMLSEFSVAEPAAYLISPVVPETTVTVLDVFRAGRHDLVLDLACQRKPASTVLDEFQPTWRTKSDRRYVVQTGEDGERALVPFSLSTG